MKRSEFSYPYPEELIAQVPSDERGGSRLLVADRHSKTITHISFSNILEILEPNDCLVVNDSKVIPARLYGQKESGGRVELVLLCDIGNGEWEAIGRASTPFKPHTHIMSGEDILGKVLSVEEDGLLIIQLDADLEKVGHIPLPPYIHRPDDSSDRERYQTVFANHLGSAAAPTAGLHWTKDLIEEAKRRGVSFVSITLHVGRGTFKPIRTASIEDHKMHEEFFEISKEAAQTINEARRVVAVGTTTVRALESASKGGKVTPYKGGTTLFIKPGYSFQVVEVLQTNFHLPESSLFVLVSAFAETTFMKQCYVEAIRERYRLFSYGDTMLIL